MNAGSLFSGIGGIELGLELEGIHTAWFIEYDPYAQAILRKNFPNTPIHGDVTKVDFENLPRVDILTGGFPCQDISNAGKRIGITGSRSSLWKYYCEAIRILRPQIAIIENVAALTNRGLDVVLGDLAEIRYDAEWYNISASSVGAFHRRERIFILAYPVANSRGVGICGGGANSGINSELRESTRGGRDGGFVEKESSGPMADSDVADSDGERCDNGSDNWKGRDVLHDEGITEEDKQEWEGRECGIGKACSDVEDTISNGIDEGNRQEIDRRKEGEEYSDKSICTSENVSDGNDAGLEGTEWETRCSSECSRGIEQYNWAFEPCVGRVAHGIPNRVDRIKCLGNAVVPAVAQSIAKTIKKTHPEG